MSSTAIQISAPLDAQELIGEPPENMELVDGQLVEKTDMTLKHSFVQANLTSRWRQYILDSGQGGTPLTEAPCKTGKQTRRPDVAYITADDLEKIGEVKVFPQSFPLIAEVASPDDKAESLLAKAKEYLHSGCQEVWLLFPENQVVIVATAKQWLIFSEGEIVAQIVLPGFQVAIADLFAY